MKPLRKHVHIQIRPRGLHANVMRVLECTACDQNLQDDCCNAGCKQSTSHTNTVPHHTLHDCAKHAVMHHTMACAMKLQQHAACSTCKGHVLGCLSHELQSTRQSEHTCKGHVLGFLSHELQGFPHSLSRQGRQAGAVCHHSHLFMYTPASQTLLLFGWTYLRRCRALQHMRSTTVVTNTHRAHGRNGILLQSRIGGSLGSICGQIGVKQVQLRVCYNRQGSEESVLRGEFW